MMLLKLAISTESEELCARSFMSSILLIKYTGVFPDRLKYASIRPLFKKGNEKDMSSYRPISILTSFSKIFEKVMHTRLLEHLTDHNILVKEQYGFRTNLTTDNATYHLTNEILNALNNNLLIGSIFCDLEKAFDCVNHKVLLTKLEFYDITGSHYSLYKSYLTNRFQRALLYNEAGTTITSSWAKTEQGVPQGSVLGPLLFLLYINDLPKFLTDKSVPILFADDTSILVSQPSPTDYMNTVNTVLKILNGWFRHNLLSLNLTKTQFTNFVTKTSNQIEISITYNNKLIPTSTHTKFLGLTVDHILTWINQK